MRAMVLGAGLGTRLGSIGLSVPKILVDVGGRPLLELQLEYLEANGIERVLINVHHLAEQVEAYVDSYAGPLDVECVYEQELLGTAGAVRNVLARLAPDPFVVLYGDVVIDEPLDAMLALHRQTGALATIAVHEADQIEGKGVVDVDAAGRVRRFVEKAPHGGGSGLINSGLYVMEGQMLTGLGSGVFADFGQDVFPHALRSGVPIFARRLREPVIDVGTPEGLAQARANAASMSSAGRRGERGR